MDIKKITFAELKQLNGKSIASIKPYEEPTEPEKGMLIINGVAVFNCYSNKVSCESDTFGFVHFYDKQGNQVANVSIFNINNECFILHGSERITSETSLRMIQKTLAYDF